MRLRANIFPESWHICQTFAAVPGRCAVSSTERIPAPTVWRIAIRPGSQIYVNLKTRQNSEALFLTKNRKLFAGLVSRPATTLARKCCSFDWGYCSLLHSLPLTETPGPRPRCCRRSMAWIHWMPFGTLPSFEKPCRKMQSLVSRTDSPSLHLQSSSQLKPDCYCVWSQGMEDWFGAQSEEKQPLQRSQYVLSLRWSAGMQWVLKATFYSDSSVDRTIGFAGPDGGLPVEQLYDSVRPFSSFFITLHLFLKTPRCDSHSEDFWLWKFLLALLGMHLTWCFSRPNQT